MVNLQRRLERVASPAARQRIGRWVGNGFWAIMDQGLFAVSNFALNVLLARWLTPADYGAFSVAYTMFLLLGTFHTAILTEPMLVFGPGKYKERLGAYLAVLLRGHWLFSALIGTLFAAAGLALWRFGNSPLSPAIFGLAVASPFILFQWLMRRACYVNLQPRLAASAGALYMVLMGVGILGTYYFGQLGPLLALIIMAGASLASGLWLVYRLGVDGKAAGSKLVRESVRDHWTYGRWAIGAAGLSWAAGNIFFIVLPIFANLEAVGTLRAAFNFIMPMMQVFAALGSVVLPELVRARQRDALHRETKLILVLYVGVAIVYGGGLVALAEPARAFIYGASYPALRSYIAVLSLLPVTGALVSVTAASLRALERPRGVFIAYLGSTAVSVSLGTLLVYRYGAFGAAVGMLLASVTTGSILLAQIARSSPSGGAADRRGVASPL